MESRLNIKHDVPFSLEEDQILYLDPICGERLSEVAFDSLCEKYAEQGLTLLSFQSIINSLPEDLLEYYLPERGNEPIPAATVLAEKLAGEMQLVLDHPQTLRNENGIWIIGYGAEGDETPEDFLENYLDEAFGRNSSVGSVMFSKCCDEGPFYEEANEIMPCACAPCPDGGLFDDSDEESNINILLEELREANEDKLRELGLSEQTLRFLLGYAKPKYSRMKVCRNASIILEDYGSREIKMDDKTKALYFLFLRHPEGLSIKDLPEHIEELLDLYQSISGRDDPQAMRKTIENLCDPFQNNANISLSRIKKAFCEAFSLLVARHYYVDGERGGLRSISLDRKLVSWETIR